MATSTLLKFKECRCHSVAVIVAALHGEGPAFEPQEEIYT